MMVRALLDLDLGGKRVLDCGCGTGILGIVAAKAGAAEVVGYDIDEWSVENTRHNARLNNVDNLEALTGDIKVLSHVDGLSDVVVANINRNILLNDMAELREVMASESLLIISGFYESDAGQLIACAQGLGLSVITTSSDGDWSSLVFSTSSES
jgi:ribosomal protein L11 methyltransferase